MFALDGPEIADTAADVSSDLLGNLIGDFQLAAVHCLLRSGDRVMNERAHLARFFFFNVVQRIEVLYFAGEAAGKPRGIELFDIVGTAAASQERCPGGLDGITYRRDQPKAGDDDATLQNQSSSRDWVTVTD